MKKKPFNPWTATAEEAIREFESGNENAVFQWQAASDIQGLRPEIEEAMELFGKEKNRTEALKKTAEAGKAILLCAKKILESGLVAPDWLSYAFNQRVYPVLHLKSAHWGDENSFGSTGYNYKRRRLKMLIREYILFNYQELGQEWQAKGKIRGYFATFVMEKVKERPFFREFAEKNEKKENEAKGAGQRIIEGILSDIKKHPFFKIKKAAK